MLKKFLQALLLCFVAIGCGPHYTPTLEKIQERGTLLVGTTGDYRPLSYKEPITGEYWGFCIDVAEEMARELGVSASYVPTSWPTLSADVQAPELFD
ncbi:MAG: transporter substrate-binding domain-containing protein, partial [Bacteroidales bacterium]|nr:transporter substrate-binding domain-containing protein [Bacteroidales bacterium]